MVALNAMLESESVVAVSKLKITAEDEIPFRLMEPPENESELPETFTTTVEPAGAVMLIVAPE